MILKKIKRILAFTLVLAMVLSFIPAVYAANDSYEKATSIAVGDTVLLVHEESKNELSGISTTSTKYGLGAVFTDAPAGAFPLTVVEGSTEGSFAFQTADGKYLYWTSGNSLNVNGTLNASTSWTVTFDADGNAVIKNTKDTSRVIYWNSGSPRFACYNKTGQQAVQLYKKVTGSSCDHANAISEDTIPATCTEDGVRTYTCECGHTWEEPIEAIGHSFTDGVCDICGYSDAEPDAPVGGYVLMQAGETLAVGDTIVIVCGSKFVEMNGFATKTNYIDGVEYTDAPMGAYPLVVFAGEAEGTFALESVDGYLTWRSGNSIISEGSLTANSSWNITIDEDDNALIVNSADSNRKLQWNASSPRFATYTSSQTAVQIYKHVIIEPTEPTEPSEEPTVPTECVHESKTVTGHQDPTCIADGYDEWTCNTCGETGTDLLPLGDDYHVPGETEVIVLCPPSCSQEGLNQILVHCTVCAKELTNTQETIPTLPHTYGENDRCTVCFKHKAGKTFYLTNDPLSATYFVIYHPASGTALSLDASGEKLMPSQVTVENGVLTTVENTAVFLRMASENEAFPMSIVTHDWYYLTSGETGNALFYAPEASEYSYWNPVLVSEADSTFQFMNAAAAYNGNKNQAMEFYKDLFTVYGVADTDAYAFQIYCDTKPACVHQWDDGVVTLEATCYSEGTLLRTCTLCQEVTKEPIPMLDHTWQATEVTPPTCYELGYTTYTCFGCGSERIDDIIPASHGDLVSEVTPPTCDEPGYTTYTCSLCGYSYDDDFIDPTGHTWLEATCTSPSVCSVCGEEGGIFLPITKASDIFDGNRIVIAVRVGDEYVALGHTVESNGKIKPTAVSAYPSHLNTYDDSLLWRVTQTEGGIALESDLGYLAHAGAKETGFKYSEEAFTWDLRSDVSGFYLYSTLADRGIMYQSSGNVFGVYADSNLTNSNYSGDLVIYRYYPGRSLPHWDENSDKYCDGCGALIEDAFLVSRSISLNGNIAVNFYMSISDKVLNGEKSPYMIFTQEEKDPVEVPLAQSRKVFVDGAPTYVFTYEVAAKEMADTITAQLFYGDSCTEEYTYSVKTYADNMRTQLAEDDALMILLDAMLRYGAASQVQFNYHTERLADEGMGLADFSNVKYNGYAIVAPQGTDLVVLAGASLLLESETTLRYFFSVDASVENLTITYNGQPLEIKTRNGLKYVDVKNISAPDLDEYFTITVNDGTNSADVSYSPMTYCRSVYENETGIHPESLVNCVAALTLYNQAANNYFG